MRTMTSKALKIAVLLVCIMSCDQVEVIEETPPPGPPPEFQDGLNPLQVGASWTYLRDIYGDGTIFDTLEIVIDRKLEATIDGEQVHGWIWERYIDGQLFNRPWDWVFSNTSQGFDQVAIVSATDSAKLSVNLYPYPAGIGATGGTVYVDATTTDVVLTDTVEVELISTSDTLDTPAGQFICFVYRYYIAPPFDVSLGDSVSVYMVPGIGQVGQIRSSESGADRVKFKQLLLKYEFLR